MLGKKYLAVAVLATAAVSTSAFAGERGVNTAIGAVAGALIGNSIGGQNAALVGGLVGAAVGNSIGGHDSGRYVVRGPRPYAPVYYRAEPVPVRHYYRPDYRYVHRVDYRHSYGYRR